ncbi:RagB/SusD family nutrient uptake outer membrane protein [Cryomorpha ignava]|uniref:RagB/SusD family nutrient uptake outer membrane protein n=1 Tax=Cryomorpha ignava TaxID=101383 RepID=A0A7K3WQ29_9FLAO|nr:RagB/SusD family nutrient uptake outer membrane protein [Cryomorpha ignava]NEN23757.1 RagB/SusD family nutrient uptake outer membrane protein [Cryomorpha ignava]
MKIRNTTRKVLIVFGASSLLLFSACSDLLEQKPSTTGSNILLATSLETGSDLREYLVSAYDVLANTYNGTYQNLPTLMTDNLVRPLNQDNYVSIWLRRSTIFNSSVGDGFKQHYIAILRANTVLENLDNVTELSPADRTKYEAEAHFIRALCHFDAVRGWAQPYGFTASNSHPGIAIRTSTEIVNAPRSSVAEVYSFVLSEIAAAKAGLPDANDVYATRWSAIALEAEVRFQQHEYDLSYQLSNQLLTEGPAIFDGEVNKYQFPQASPESYFYIYSATRDDGVNVDSRNAGFRDNYFNGGNPRMLLPQDLYTTFKQYGDSTARGVLYGSNDQDGNITYFTRMFDAQFFNIPVFTYTQMLLIRAESAAEINGDIATAIADINAIRERAYGSNVGNLLATASANEVKEAARLERRLEFPFNGQRFHDLKRMGSQGENIIVRDAPWDCNGMVLQFPAVEATDFFPLNPTGGC